MLIGIVSSGEDIGNSFNGDAMLNWQNGSTSLRNSYGRYPFPFMRGNSASVFSSYVHSNIYYHRENGYGRATFVCGEGF